MCYIVILFRNNLKNKNSISQAIQINNDEQQIYLKIPKPVH